jgi:hypothetical protein
MRHKSDNQRDGIAFLEVNLDTQEAGFMKAGDMDGVINRIPWNQSQVLQVADFLDLFLTDYTQFFSIYFNITNPNVRLLDAWISVSRAEKLIFVPSEKLIFLSIGFRVLVNSKESELAQMKVKDPALFSYIGSFNKVFDNSFEKVISPDDKRQYIRRLIRLNNTVRKDLMEPVTNLYVDPDKLQLLETGAKFQRQFGRS